MKDACDIAIIGAGAAGLAAGIFAAEAARAAGVSLRIVILDGAKTIGAKILVSGGGRCNVTHDKIVPEDYSGPRTIVRNVLAAFDEAATVRWMESLGVSLKHEDTGKLFPVTDSARTVLAGLLNRLAELGVEVRASCRVIGIDEDKLPDGGRDDELPNLAKGTDSPTAAANPPPINSPVAIHAHLQSRADTQNPIAPRLVQPHFRVHHSQGGLLARRVIFCTGGRSLPRTGSDGTGWAILRKLGHTVTDTWPALVPLMLEGMFNAEVSGLSHEAELATFVEGKRVDCRTGSLLWTHFGISGPVVMDASRFWTIARGRNQSVEVRCNLLPGESFEQVEKWLIDLSAKRPRLTIGKLIAERFPSRLADALLHYIGIDTAQILSQLSRDARRKIVHALTALPLLIARDRGWNYAEVTAGGVPLAEIDFRTMASRRLPGLYLAGEVLDCDGRIGGFNFQWAWATGYLAGRAAVKSLG